MNLTFSEFDPKFLETISGSEELKFSEERIYYTIRADAEKVGVVGGIMGKEGFFIQVAVRKDFRCRDITGIVENLFAEKEGCRKLFATIGELNTDSIRAHRMNGFIEVSEKRKNFF